MNYILIAAGWLVCGVLAYGVTLGDYLWQTEKGGSSLDPEWKRNDLSFSVFIGLLGPLGLLVSFFLSGFAQHGLRWKL